MILLLYFIVGFVLADMAPTTSMPAEIQKIVINGEEYWPTPHEVNPDVYSEDMVWTQFPWDPAYMSDPTSGWFDALGQNAIVQRRIWGIPTDEGQIVQFRQLLHDFPGRSLDMMFEAAMKGKAHIVRFLLREGVKPTADTAEESKGFFVPLHTAAHHGRLDVVKIFVEEAGLTPNTPDDMGGTPLMRACWGNRIDVVRYFLSQPNVDILIRQKVYEGDESRTSALDFAAGAGCLECVDALLDFAKNHDIDDQGLITPLVIEAAASSNNLELLRSLISRTSCALPDDTADSFPENICSLTPAIQGGMEAAFVRSFRTTADQTLPLLYTYITSVSPEGAPNFPTLSDQSYESLMDSMIHFTASKNPSEYNARDIPNFTIVQDVLFESQFATEGTLGERNRLINDAFFNAAQFNNLPFLQYILDLFLDDVNPNHLSRVNPLTITSLYTSSKDDHVDILKFFHSNFIDRIDPHIGNGKLANGPTALARAIMDGQITGARLLLSLFHGPVESIDAALTATPPAPGTRIVLTTQHAYRFPVRVWSESRFNETFDAQVDPDVTLAPTGTVRDTEGGEVKYLILPIEEGDEEWWSRIEMRKSDEELAAREGETRELKPNPNATTQPVASWMLADAWAWAQRRLGY